MKTLKESILSSTKSGIGGVIEVELDKFAKQYLTEEQWRFIAAHAKNKFPEIYKIIATKGDGYRYSMESNTNTWISGYNADPNVDIKIEYGKYKRNNNNNLRACRMVLDAIHNIEIPILQYRDHLFITWEAKTATVNLHYKPEIKYRVNGPKQSQITPEIKEIMDKVIIKDI